MQNIEIAGTIVNIFSMSHKIHDFISMLLSAEISNTGVDHSNVIFRGNTLTTKVIDVYMKVTGFEYAPPPFGKERAYLVIIFFFFFFL